LNLSPVVHDTTVGVQISELGGTGITWKDSHSPMVVQAT
jgi:hypothetical protein